MLGRLLCFALVRGFCFGVACVRASVASRFPFNPEPKTRGFKSESLNRFGFGVLGL